MKKTTTLFKDEYIKIQEREFDYEPIESLWLTKKIFVVFKRFVFRAFNIKVWVYYKEYPINFGISEANTNPSKMDQVKWIIKEVKTTA